MMDGKLKYGSTEGLNTFAKKGQKQETVKDGRIFSSYLQAVRLPGSNELGHQEVGVEKVHVLI